jgi:hypothetical protein
LFNSRLLRPLRWGLLVAVASVGLASCDEKLSDLTGPTPNLQPTLSSIQTEIFSQRCAGCHTAVGRVPPLQLNLTDGNAFANLVGVAARGKAGATRVVPGDPDNSYLIQKIEGAPGIVGVRMPFQGAPLTDGQILVIRRWIQTGAANN